MGMIRFILCALWYRVAYIDLDGCLLHRLSVPAEVPRGQALQWWMDNLCPTPIVRKRLALLYFLRRCGVRLYIWTNRSPRHEQLTRDALGEHGKLFSGAHFLAGHKNKIPRIGPCMDDQDNNVGGHRGDVLVHSVGPSPRRDPI